MLSKTSLKILFLQKSTQKSKFEINFLLPFPCFFLVLHILFLYDLCKMLYRSRMLCETLFKMLFKFTTTDIQQYGCIMLLWMPSEIP